MEAVKSISQMGCCVLEKDKDQLTRMHARISRLSYGRGIFWIINLPGRDRLSKGHIPQPDCVVM